MGKIKNLMIDRMNAEKQFSKIKFKEWTCYVVATYYTTEDRKAILLIDTDDNQSVAVATVNMSGYPCKDNQVYIKNYSENTGILECLIDHGILLSQPVSKLQNKFVKVPLMQLTPEALNLWVGTDNKN